ncbi:MAG: hypothetical protein LBC52_02955 [Treponema sp.]|jgi:hypothetical protein|nr:hypothetical protein [Treponema sp.]
MKKKILLLVIICFFSCFSVFAQSESDDLKTKTPYPALKLDFPLFDLPYQIDAMNTVGHGFFSGYANPSMAQSLALSVDIVSSYNFGLKYFYDHVTMNERLKRIIYAGATALGVVVFFYLPGAEGWMHEEYHRSIMTRFGVNSFNTMNLFPIGATVIPVTGIKDEDLIRMKEESSVDMTRMYEAGIEGQYLQVSRLQRNNFFYNQGLLNEIGYWLSTLNSHGYIYTSAYASLIQSGNEKEGERDFAGSDFTAWVYALFRPDEPFEDRGTHPTGEGVDRYITLVNLNDDELRYLQLQVGLQFFNYISPMMIGIRSIPLGDSGFDGNFAMRHYLTSFGFDVSAQAYLKKSPFNMIFTLHNYINYRNWFPAIEAELIDYPYNIGKLEMLLSPRVLIGIQPKDQTFKTASPEFLGLFGLRVDFNISKHFLPYLDFAFKTNGWVAGNEFLNANASIRLGASLRF